MPHPSSRKGWLSRKPEPVVADPRHISVASTGGSVSLKSRISNLFGQLLRGKYHSLAIAVSGGVDSMALAWLVNAWRRESQCYLTILTVDHKLRLGSDEEALQVGTWMADWGLPHHILPWEGEKMHA